MTDIELYNKAKEAYYNGTPIMEDFEFDELERKLGLENKSYVGAKHNPSYTVKHPLIMGSLSKVQIKKAEDGSIDWDKYLSEINNYIRKYNNNGQLIITPKFDGCSFEMCCQMKNGNLVINSISTRGDGDWGRDIRKHIENKLKDIVLPDESEYVLRGEVLIDKQVFADKYSDFVNPRSFVSGLLNRDYDENDAEFMSMIDDFSVVVYDVRVFNGETWIDRDWMNYHFPCAPQTYMDFQTIRTADELERIYNIFAEYREKCPFALDGIVLKPIEGLRRNNTTDARPKDCVAIKFVPMLEETVVEEIIWSTRKTNELRPVIRVKAVTMDGKQVTKASAHNYGFLIDNKVSVGTKVILSLAGDIIPFIYKITNTDDFDASKLCLPADIETYQEGCHLYKKLSVEEENRLKFLASAAALNIQSIGPAAAAQIYDYMIEECKGDEFFGTPAKETPNNILLVRGADINRALGGKLGVNATKAYNEYIKNISLKDIIVSCAFESCGGKIAEQIENYMLTGDADFSHLAEKAYKWVYDFNSSEYTQVKKIMSTLGVSVNDFKTVYDARVENAADQIPVILTGEPNDYDSKGDFLKKHPEYRMTTSWKEVQIVFTNDMNSKTAKMKKALEKGIEIKLY